MDSKWQKPNETTQRGAEQGSRMQVHSFWDPTDIGSFEEVMTETKIGAGEAALEGAH